MVILTRRFLKVYSRKFTSYSTKIHGHVTNASNVAFTCTVGHITSKLIQQFFPATVYKSLLSNQKQVLKIFGSKYLAPLADQSWVVHSEV